jgi:hypothetical protein
MEAAGVYRAARGRCPMLAIRGISDIVGFKRDEDWIAYACRSAAHFARAYLRTTPVTPSSLGTALREPSRKTTTLHAPVRRSPPDELAAPVAISYVPKNANIGDGEIRVIARRLLEDATPPSLLAAFCEHPAGRHACDRGTRAAFAECSL